MYLSLKLLAAERCSKIIMRKKFYAEKRNLYKLIKRPKVLQQKIKRQKESIDKLKAKFTIGVKRQSSEGVEQLRNEVSELKIKLANTERNKRRIQDYHKESKKSLTQQMRTKVQEQIASSKQKLRKQSTEIQVLENDLRILEEKQEEECSGKEKCFDKGGKTYDSKMRLMVLQNCRSNVI